MALDEERTLSGGPNIIGPLDVSAFKQIRVVVYTSGGSPVLFPQIVVSESFLNLDGNILDSSGKANRTYDILGRTIRFNVIAGSGGTARILVFGRSN